MSAVWALGLVVMFCGIFTRGPLAYVLVIVGIALMYL